MPWLIRARLRVRTALDPAREWRRPSALRCSVRKALLSGAGCDITEHATNFNAALRATAVLGFATLLLSACSSTGPGWTAGTAHLNVTVNGPGRVTLASDSLGEVTCREDSLNSHCYFESGSAVGETVTVTAVPDEGHAFISWLKHPGFTWTDELARNENPVQIILDGDYQFHANFR